MRTLTIGEGGAEAEVDTLGAYVSSVSLDYQPLIKPSHDGMQTHGGIAVLIPYAGRVRDGIYRFEGRSFKLPIESDGHAIHGFAKSVRWRILEERKNSVLLASLLKREGYPGVLETRIEYSITGASFSTKCLVRNAGNRNCPLVVGFHPYFLADVWRISVAGTAHRYELSGGYFPTGKKARFSFRRVGRKRDLDDCFQVSGIVRFAAMGREIVIRRQNMPYLVVYNGKYAEGRSVAIEPYTGLDDAYNNGIGLRILKPGDVFRCGYDIGLRHSRG